MKKQFSHSIVGGTFDRFHVGHKKLLDTTFSQSEFVTIGISTKELYKTKFLAEIIEDYAVREAYIADYLKENSFEKKANIVPIDDIYGTSLQEKNIDALFVTEENIRAAGLINQKRIEHNLAPLEIISVPLVIGNDGQVITSERIRKGEIDRSGNVYALLFQQTALSLPHTLRADLRNPIGIVAQDSRAFTSILERAFMVIAVGDIVSITLAEMGIQADVSVIDLKTRRRELSQKQEQVLQTLTPSFVVANKSGKIEKEAVAFLQEAFAAFLQNGLKQTVKILGEEDLLTLPAILLAPLRSVVLYGQFDEGAVLVEVTEEKKFEIKKIVDQFDDIV